MTISSDTLNSLKGKRVLVTGSTGFKGSWLCTWLVEIGAIVYGFALPPKLGAPLFDQLQLGNRIDQHNGDIRNFSDIEDVIKQTRPEIIIHLAAQALVRRSYHNPKETFDTNIGGGINLLEAVRNSLDVKALVFITSDKCYRNKEWIWGYRENDEIGGPDPYSASKAAAENVFEGYYQSFLSDKDQFGAVTARAGNVIGGGDLSEDRIVPDCIRALRNENPIEVRNPLATRPWQHVLEPLSGYLTLAINILKSPAETTGAWNFGPNTENVRPVIELAEMATNIWGRGSVDILQDILAPHESNLLMLSSDKAKSQLAWQPLWNFERCVSETIEWYRKTDAGNDPLELTLAQISSYVSGSEN
jgi:CDP-glucose 4,6-dehydratase